MELEELSAQVYAEKVLPLTQPLWAQGRSLEQYVAETLELAHTLYGRRYYRTFALTNGTSHALATFKRYEREARARKQRLRAIGIGAVFTPEDKRGRGYASAMLGLALDEARTQGFDFAYLFSDIHPQFYKQLGFVELPSRSISVRADSLSGERIATHALAERDWSAVRKCFDACDAQREFGLTRSPLVWEWIRTRLRHRYEHRKGQPVELVVRSARTVGAYVIGVREPAHDAFVIDEFAFANPDGARIVARLLRSGAGDLRRVIAWLPPAPARALLPAGSVRRRTGAIWMAAPLSREGSTFVDIARTAGRADGIWALDHI
jgi:predicted N-acetyltransferase YhbS